LQYTQIDSRIVFWQTRRPDFAFEEGRPIFGDKYSLPSSNAKVGMPGQPKPIFESICVYILLPIQRHPGDWGMVFKHAFRGRA
jgi:hypothetical protein